MIGLCPAGYMGSTQRLFRRNLIPHVAIILTRATPVTLTRSPDCFSDKKLASVYPTNASVNSSCAQPPPPPPPRATAGRLPALSVQGWGIYKFCAARGPGICQPRDQPRTFDTHAVSYPDTATERIFIVEKQADWLIC